MGSGRGRRILRKMLEFLHLSAPCALVIAPPLYTSAAPKANTSSNGYADQPPQYTAGGETEKANPLRQDLETYIVQLWKKVYLGLYEIDDSDQYRPRYRYDQLEALFLGAGLTRPFKLGELYVIRRRFVLCGASSGMLALKLFDHLSIPTLHRVVATLEAYEKEIANLVRLETLLRNSQLALVPPASDPSAATDTLRQQYLDIAEPMGKRIEWYDTRMEVLNHDILNEAIVMDNGRHRLKGQFVYHKAFPGRFDK